MAIRVLLLCQTTCRDADVKAHHQRVEQIPSAQLEAQCRRPEFFVKMGGEITEAMSGITGTNVPS